MSLQDQYQRFLTSPSTNRSFLHDNASYHYITSGVSINSADAIVKNLQVEGREINKHVEKVISSVATADSLALEVEAEYEFVISGGNFVPGLDDNFVTDHTVTFPLIHFVSFKDGRISQIRLFWDQGTLLKQLEVVGRTGRNWPIKDGKDQVQMIRKSVEAQGFASSESAPPAKAPAMSRDQSINSSSGSESAARGPKKSSLSLYDDDGTFDRPKPPRANSAYRPPQRDLADIIGEDDEEARRRAANVVSPKAKSVYSRDKTFELGRVIDEEHDAHRPRPPKARSTFTKGQTFSLGDYNEQEDAEAPAHRTQKSMHVDPRKYHHFEFGNGDEAEEPVSPPKVKNPRNAPSWNFEDFNTPEKKPAPERRDDRRTFSWSDDETDTPVKQQKKSVIRTDNQPQFALTDDSPADKRPLGNLSNRQARPNDVTHFEISDNSPANLKAKQKAKKPDPVPVGEEEGDDFFSHMTASKVERGIRIQGNGQGKLKTAGPDTQPRAQLWDN